MNKGGRMKTGFVAGVWSILFVMMFTTVSFGAGFQVPEQGAAAVGMGMAFTGKADDLSAIYYNPAGLTQLKGTHLYLGVSGISPKATYTRTGFAGEDTKNDLIPVPLFAISTDLGGKLNNVVLAFAVNVPFGLRDKYDALGAQRYMSTNISLQDIYIGPYVGWQVTPKVSIGGGVQYVYSTAEIESKVNYGGAIYQMMLQRNPAMANPALNENPDYDGIMEIKNISASNIAGNIGILVKPTDKLNIGLSWRSGVKVGLEGDATLTIPATVTQLTGFQTLKTKANTDVSLAQVVGIGFAYRPIEKLTITSDLNWINWKAFKNYDIDFKDNTAYLPDKPQPRDWKDTIAIRLGMEYWLAERYAVRAGYAFDQNPIPDKSLGPELPTGDTHYVTLGFGYKWNKLTLDVAYAHLFIKDRTVTSSIRSPQPLGEYESSANIFGISVGYAL
jgi:long-chain fatty acid transport protein